MSCSLPPEIFDLVIDCLCDEPTALKACCLASKSWVPRTRKHLFARIYFRAVGFTVQSWMKAFPDPSNSPAHHTRDLRIYETPTAESTWIRSFHNLERLIVLARDWDDTIEVSLVQLRGLSPTLKSLHLDYFYLPLSDVFDLVCSFPLLEDLVLRFEGSESDGDEVVVPSTPPKLTGTLSLNDQVYSAARILLNLPGGLHFTKIVMTCAIEDAGSTMDLVLGCSGTLESLCIDHYPIEFETPPPLDLSHAAKLKDVEFRFTGSSVQWITTTLQTAKSKHLQQITLFAVDMTEEVDHREWQDLDHLLVRLRTSRSITPKIKYTSQQQRMDAGDLVPSLLAELVNGGIVCEVEDYWES